ncbi:hypothetical protein [Sphingomonas sp.]|uniref:hypothetical protein n=1 Tax=Sphingomonas sp. TaxID=28214 RepID=UPI0038A84A64
MKALWLDELPAAFAKAHQLGNVVEITLSQVVASYVFYLFFVHWQETSDKRIVAPYVVKHATRVYGDCIAQLAEINRVSGHQLDFDNASEAEVKAAFAAVSMSSPPNMVIDHKLTRATWFQYFWNQQTRTNESINRLMQMGRLISADLAKRLVDVNDCSFFNSMPFLLTVEKFRNPTLESWAGIFFEYLEACRRVKEWVESHR